MRLGLRRVVASRVWPPKLTVISGLLPMHTTVTNLGRPQLNQAISRQAAGKFPEERNPQKKIEEYIPLKTAQVAAGPIRGKDKVRPKCSKSQPQGNNGELAGARRCPGGEMRRQTSVTYKSLPASLASSFCSLLATVRPHSSACEETTRAASTTPLPGTWGRHTILPSAGRHQKVEWSDSQVTSRLARAAFSRTCIYLLQ